MVARAFERAGAHQHALVDEVLKVARGRGARGAGDRNVGLLPIEWVKLGLKVASLRGRIAYFSGQKICHGFGMRKYQRLCDTNRFPAFCPEQQERCDLRTQLRPK